MLLEFWEQQDNLDENVHDTRRGEYNKYASMGKKGACEGKKSAHAQVQCINVCTHLCIARVVTHRSISVLNILTLRRWKINIYGNNWPRLLCQLICRMSRERHFFDNSTELINAGKRKNTHDPRPDTHDIPGHRTTFSLSSSRSQNTRILAKMAPLYTTKN